MAANMYTYSNVKYILQQEERKGRLRLDTYSAESQISELSRLLKDKRKEIRSHSREDAAELKHELQQLQEQYSEALKKEHESIIDAIVGKNFDLSIGMTMVKGKDAYVSNNCHTTIISKIISQELQRAYKIKPQNRDVVIEQLCGLLHGQMAKVVIRADVCDFFESIPQDKLMGKLAADCRLSALSQKYLRKFIYEFNQIRHADKSMLGIPRGLSFSSYLSEVYLKDVDSLIQAMPGVYFYKRYVDDIVLIANPNMGTPQEYWNKFIQCFEGTGLTIHEEPKKKYISIWDMEQKEGRFSYLGYEFNYNRGLLEILLSQKRYDKYAVVLKAIFEIYAACGHYRTFKKSRNEKDKKTDALHQLVLRLRVLTGNGLLSGRKNYVATGVYYSNKFLTTTRQLAELDQRLRDLVDTGFCPPTNLFNYSEENGYEQNVKRIREQLKQFSFVESFNNPNLIRKSQYSLIQTQLRKIYENRIHE